MYCICEATTTTYTYVRMYSMYASWRREALSRVHPSNPLCIPSCMWSDYSSADTSVHHWVYVAAEDSGSPQMTTFYNVTVRLMDINDNPPQLLNISPFCETGAPSNASVKEVCWSKVREWSVFGAGSMCRALYISTMHMYVRTPEAEW